MKITRRATTAFGAAIIFTAGCDREWTTRTISPIGCDANGLSCRVDVVENREHTIVVACGGVRRDTLASYEFDFARLPAGGFAGQPRSVRAVSSNDPSATPLRPCDDAWKYGVPFDTDALTALDPSPAWADAVRHAAEFADTIPRPTTGCAFFYLVSPDCQCLAIYPSMKLGNESPDFIFNRNRYRRLDAYVLFSRSMPLGKVVDRIDGATTLVDPYRDAIEHWLPDTPDGICNVMTVDQRTGSITRSSWDLRPWIDGLERSRIAAETSK